MVEEMAPLTFQHAGHLHHAASLSPLASRLSQKLNEEYEFVEKEGPSFARLTRSHWGRAGGRRADPDDSDDEGDDVSFEGFCAWWPPFVAMLEQRKRDEFEVIKDMSVRQYERWQEETPMASRNLKYPMLHVDVTPPPPHPRQPRQARIEEMSSR